MPSISIPRVDAPGELVRIDYTAQDLKNKNLGWFRDQIAQKTGSTTSSGGSSPSSVLLYNGRFLSRRRDASLPLSTLLSLGTNKHPRPLVVKILPDPLPSDNPSNCRLFFNITDGVGEAKKTVRLDVCPEDTIAVVKSRLYNQQGIPSTITLRCNGQFLEDSNTVQFYIAKGTITPWLSTLQAIYPLKGGDADVPRKADNPVRFVNLTTHDKGGIVRREWATESPRWRQTDHGLNLEGKCSNMTCAAHGERVIMSMGFGTFDIVDMVSSPENYSQCVCPCCKKMVVPQTCAFVNSWWTYDGVIQPEGHSETEVVAMEGWKHADNAYHVFEPPNINGELDDGMAGWISLMLYAEKGREGDVKPPPRKRQQICGEDELCAICFETMGRKRRPGEKERKVEKLERCGHYFHAKCVGEWEEAVRLRGGIDGDAKCPLCMTEIHRVTMKKKVKRSVKKSVTTLKKVVIKLVTCGGGQSMKLEDS
ncbi:hypothetical protein BC938DRAFT_476278 [Jimgerdemannia flammicorona]|uniref:RING-type domain-containing protein n=1 Tax=Jimgerdemannia flammicorona TaxID=994334 RepID=A0A433PIK5_9FUNG|nr:hypothetical protein BC938DRAFT_476278 [Jimgerdemannia flammicorona]